jgi:hypothetical protein
MTDSDMLVLAAKAAGYKVLYGDDRIGLRLKHENRRFWKPLDDDGDAMRLAVKLRMVIHHTPTYVVTISYDTIHASHEDGTSTEATCRAIVRTAAEIGKGME